jgi:RND superfamily putative drug exporter
MPVLVAQRAIDRVFPGSADTAELVISGHGLASALARARLTQLARDGQRVTAAPGTPSVRVAADGETALVTIPIRDQNRGVADRSVAELRAQLKPVTARLIPGARAQLGGDDADNVDFTARLSRVTPLVIAFVLALAFVLLVAAFRSPWLALAVIGLNLLSVGAAFGALVAVFQHHWA